MHVLQAIPHVRMSVAIAPLVILRENRRRLAVQCPRLIEIVALDARASARG
jgi:hypothetical protein